MNKFVLAFPVNVPQTAPFKLTETFQIDACAKTVMIPGCSVMFDVVRKERCECLSDIFREHNEISLEEAKDIDSHESLLFLLGNVKNAEELGMVNGVIMKVLAAGAKGVYMQHSGTAWTASAFREELDDAEFPMDPWINFVEGPGTLYTLGLETFGMPDLCISVTSETAKDSRDILSVVADSVFVDGVSSKSGTEVDGGDAGTFVLRAEAKSPFSKDDPEFNKRGLMRLFKK